jgi:hypothetical protein
MNRRDFLKIALAAGAVAGTVGHIGAQEVYNFKLENSSLLGLLDRLVKQPDQRIAVVIDHKFVKDFDKQLRDTSQLANIAHYQSHSRLMFANNTTIYLYDIDNPSQLRGPQHHTGIIVGKPKYPEVVDMLMFTLRLGEAPTLFTFDL